MNAPREEIRLSTLAVGALKTVPRLPIVVKGTLRLLTIKRNSQMSIGLLVQQAAERHPDRLALLFEDRRWTYAQFNTWANRLAAVYKANGVKQGDRVAILIENRAEVLVSVLAAVKIGAVASLLNYNQRGESLTHSLAITAPKLVVVTDECKEALDSTPYAPAQGKVSTLWLGTGATPQGCKNFEQEVCRQSGANHPETADLSADHPCFLIFTSGTTGLPKASLMTHYRWIRAMAGVGQMSVRLGPNDILYCPLPLYHNNALTISWGAALGAGAALALTRKFSVSRFWDEIRNYHATAFCYIGELCRYLLNRPEQPNDQDHLVHTIVGNGLRPDIWEQFENRFNIHNIAEFYGASENNLVFINGIFQRKTAGFCPLSYAIVEFDAEHETPRLYDGFMRKVEKGGVGLLLSEISDRAPFDGYTDKKATETKIFNDVFQKGDRWFNSGDLVRDQGFRHIAFVDRVGDTFRWKGENVATTEVESAFSDLAGIEHAVVYGVQIPNCDGRAGMAALSMHDTAFDGQALANHLRTKLPPYAVPLFIRLREKQETTSTFKYSKVELKRQGFDPHQISEPLYVLLNAGRGYEPLTLEVYAQIAGGAVRL